MATLLSVSKGRIVRSILGAAPAVALLLLIGCKPIDLRTYVIEQVVGLEPIALDSPTATNDIGTTTITWQEIENAVRYRYQWDSTDPDGWTETEENSFVPEMELTEGTHTLYLQAQNEAGLWSPIYAFEFTFDASLTDAPLVIGPEQTSSRRPTWQWSEVEGAAGYAYQLDAVSDAGWDETASLSYTPGTDLAVGEHTLYVRAKNSAGAWSGWGRATVEVIADDDDPDDPADTDTTAPTVASSTPTDGSTGVAVTATVSITFSEAMDTTATEGAFSLFDGGSSAVTGSFSWSSGDTVMTFTPSANLTEGETYTYALTTAATDVAGNPLTAALGDTSFTVVALFSGSTALLADGGFNGHNKDLIWDSVAQEFVAALYTDTNKLHLSAFADATGIAMASTAMLQSHNPTYLGDARILRTGATYSVVFEHNSKIYFNKVVTPISGAQDASIELYTTTEAIRFTAAAWNPDDQEIAIAWIEGLSTSDDIWFMRVDTDGSVVEAAVNLTSAPDTRHSVDLFWTGSSYSIVYVEDSTVEKGFLRVVTPGSPSTAGAAVQLTPNTHDVRNPLGAVWTGTELGVAWLDAANGKIPYFNRYNASGALVSGMPAGGSEVLTDYSGTDYTSGYNTVYDNIDLAYDGAGTYALVWSQRDEKTANVGAYETQFCSIEDVSGTWKAPAAPIIISQDDGNTNRNLYPHVVWDGSTWAATWVVTNDPEIYFRQ